jgi:phosphoglucosamine mutase
VKAAIAAAERALEGRGRLLVRKSGTEPLIRVMAEGQDEALVAETVEAVCAAVAKAA